MSVLRGVLLSLGLSETARAMDAEAPRLRDKHKKDKEEEKNKEEKEKEEEEEEEEKEEREKEKKVKEVKEEENCEWEMHSVLRRALAPADGAESKLRRILRELCSRGFADENEREREREREREEEDENSESEAGEIQSQTAESADSIAPLVCRLTHALLSPDESENDKEESEREREREEEESESGFSRVCVLFSQYAEVQWAQLRLAEAVACADFSRGGWPRRRAALLARLFRLQAALQRLLLEANLRDNQQKDNQFGDNQPIDNQEKDSQCGDNQCGDNQFGDNQCGDNQPRDNRFYFDNRFFGDRFFVRGAAALRQNADDVAAWVMRRCAKEGAAARANKKQTREKRENGEREKVKAAEGARQSRRKPWEALLSVVRQIVLTDTTNDKGKQNNIQNGNNNNNINSNTNSHDNNTNGNSERSAGGDAGAKRLRTPPALRWSLVLQRIEFLAWVVGSAAEIADVARDSSRTLTGDALIGAWYSNCTAHIRELTSLSHSARLSSSSSVSSLSSSSSSSFFDALPQDDYLSCRTRACAAEALRRAALNILTDPFPAPQFGALRVCLSNSAQNTTAKERVALLAALATGRPCDQKPSRDISRRVPLQCVVRSALCAHRTLLELQDSEVPFDAQLQTLENMAAFAFTRQKQQKQQQQQQEEKQQSSDQLANSACDAEASPGGEAEAQRQTFSRDSLRVGADTAIARADLQIPTAEEAIDSPSTAYRYMNTLMRSIVGSAAQVTGSNVVLLPALDGGDDEEEESNAEEDDRSRNKLSNEVQVVTVSSCGTLMAFITTKGRLVVFALRNGDVPMEHETHNDGKLFCEELILDTLLMDEVTESCWYEQLAVLLAFSPDARFLLCAVQNAPPWVKEGREPRRAFTTSAGKIRIYSLHKNTSVSASASYASGTNGNRDKESDKGENGDHIDPSNTSNGNNGSENGKHSSEIGSDINSFTSNTERLFADFKIHSAPVTVARWLDPRFWSDQKSNANYVALSNDTPLWRRAAHWHLSQLQCLSTARDGFLVRWSPANGIFIQRIATYPVYDILVSPLMQAFYTINQFGQLFMYDAWNEQDIKSPTEKVILVSQRGLPSSLSAMHHPTPSREDGADANSVAPLADGELPPNFFVGARRICFDRRCAAQGRSDADAIGAHMSRVMRADKISAGTGTRAGGRLGRRILTHMLRHDDDDDGVSHAQAVLQSSSGTVSSASSSSSLLLSDANDEDEEREARGSGSGRHRRCRPRGHRDGARESMDYESAFSFLRNRHLYGGRHRNDRDNRASVRETGGGERGTMIKDAVLYKTGSRLVFEEVSQALCHTAGIWPSVHESSYAPSPQPYSLLAMSASGNAIWGDDNERTDFVCHRCRSCGLGDPQSSLFSTCTYYSDRQHSVGANGKVNGEANGRMPSGKSPVTPFQTRRPQQRQSALCTCRRHCKARRALSPTARNGRYISITASVGPSRSLVQYDRSLEFHAGIYACVVFDLLYGTVVRVIPVCPTQPLTALTENGVIASHAHTKKAPIYAIPCSMVLVKRPTTTADTSNASTSTTTTGATPVTSFHGKVNSDNISGINANKNGNGFGSLPRENNDSSPPCHQETDSILLLVVGGLHSTAYVFDALSGSRMKKINLRKNKAALSDNTANRPASSAKGARPPSKRIRRSYMRLGESESHRHRHSRASTKDDDENESYSDSNDDFETDDTGSSSDCSESLYMPDEDPSEEPRALSLRPDGNETARPLRRAFVRQLMRRHGVSAVIRATAEMLRAAPLPLSPFSLSFSSFSSFSSSSLSSASLFSSSSSAARCPSFLGLLRLSAEDFFDPRERQRQEGEKGEREEEEREREREEEKEEEEEERPHEERQKRQRNGGGAARGHRVPFAPAAPQQREIRRVWADGKAAARKVRSPSGAASDRMRCGVVNSVALLHDSANGGVYVFSSDELGGLFITGGLMR